MELLDLAEHNKRACAYLYSHGEFPDWVITTAYYSAAKYIEGHLFPFNTGIGEYASFAKFYNEEIGDKEKVDEQTGRQPTKHKALLQLTYNRIYPIYGDFKFLYDHCMNARYNTDYKGRGSRFAEPAWEAINKIEGHIKHLQKKEALAAKEEE